MPILNVPYVKPVCIVTPNGPPVTKNRANRAVLLSTFARAKCEGRRRENRCVGYAAFSVSRIFIWAYRAVTMAEQPFDRNWVRIFYRRIT